MSKPAAYRVHYSGAYLDFTCRARARGFAMVRRSQGDTVHIEAIQ